MTGKNEAITDEPRNKTIQVDPETYAAIEKLAAEAERTISKQANRILKQALAGDITGN